jgi:RNA-directed DNA polymerase
VVCCQSRQQAGQVTARLAGWPAPRGLAFNEENTRIVSLEAGYDFLGFNIRRYRNGKLLIKPGKAAVRRVKYRLAGQMRRLRGHNASAVLAAICPVTRAAAMRSRLPDFPRVLRYINVHADESHRRMPYQSGSI